MFFENCSTRLFYREWPIANPKAQVVIVHGLGEHSGRYEHVAKALNENGYSAFALDHRGHGQSEGPKGHVRSFTDYHADLKVFIETVRAKHSDLDVHLLGHSMGAMITTGYVLRHNDIKSVILSAPPYGVPGKGANTQLKIGAFMGRFLPTVGLSNKIDPKTVCKNSEVVDKYIADELVHGTITLGWGSAFVDEQNYIKEHMSLIKLPYLLMLADEDILTDPEVAKQQFQSVGSENKKLVVYPNSYHEILNEIEEGEQAMQEIIAWLTQF